VQEHRRLKRLLQEITSLQLELIPPAPAHKSPARRQGLALGGLLARTVAHFFPDLPKWLGRWATGVSRSAFTYGRALPAVDGPDGLPAQARLTPAGSASSWTRPGPWPTSIASLIPNSRRWPIPTP